MPEAPPAQPFISFACATQISLSNRALLLILTGVRCIGRGPLGTASVHTHQLASKSGAPLCDITVSNASPRQPYTTLLGDGRLPECCPPGAWFQCSCRLALFVPSYPHKERLQFVGVDDAPLFGRGGRHNGALPNKQLAATSLLRSSCSAFDLPDPSPCIPPSIPQTSL